ncbi:MAG: sterol desaturase family protein [Candidatus Nitronauta litoralis]|uniref:Sterol desaturase family protein n=1 Tax=Candidatus Nitronauta litoralis TaxID=2705533 RepID=A0A7T0G144_9BACT|nr:MAG: sterol desaturase family protein [Candidatus Nitronauta litoralis]
MSMDQIRLSIFIGVFLLMLVLEQFIQRHPTVDSKARRLAINLGLTLLNTGLVKLIFGAAAAGVAAYAQSKGWGLLNILNVPAGLNILISVIVLDFSIYWQHVLVHTVPLFWRFHIVHHSDLDLDVSSGFRFHPLEIVFSMLYKMLVVLLLGPSVIGVVVFEAILNGMAQFSHSNITLPLGLDRALRYLLVTPDMHRIHHSVERDETDSNYGFNLSIWDRWFGTYNDHGRKPQPEIDIGVPQFRKPNEVSFGKLISMPVQVRFSQPN